MGGKTGGIMADVELCTNSDQGPYLVANEGLADRLRTSFDTECVPCEVHVGRLTGDAGPIQCFVLFGRQVVLGVISQILNNHEYDWELSGM